MPNGRVHTSVTVLTSMYVGAFLVDRIAMGILQPNSLFAVAGCLSGVFLSPDLDLDGGYIGDGIIKRRLGCVLGTLWFYYWRPYSLLIPHRSWISHAPLVSTAIRLVYMFWWSPVLLAYSTDAYIWMLWFAAGLALVDFHHWFLDFVSPDGGNEQ